MTVVPAARARPVVSSVTAGSPPAPVINLRPHPPPRRGCTRDPATQPTSGSSLALHRAPPAHLPVLRLRLPRALSRSAPPPASTLSTHGSGRRGRPASPHLCVAWGRRRSGERGGTSCPARAELPSQPENSVPRVVLRGSGRRGGEGRSRTVPGTPGPVRGAMVSLPVKAGGTAVGSKGPGGQSWEGGPSGAQLRMERAGAVG